MVQNLLQAMWLAKLLAQVRNVLAPIKDKPLDEQADRTDTIRYYSLECGLQDVERDVTKLVREGAESWKEIRRAPYETTYGQ